MLLVMAILVAALPLFAQTAEPNLSGYWDFSINVGERVTKGELTLGRSGDGYVGTLTPAGTNTLGVRSLKLDANRAVALIVDTPEGVVTFDGTLGEDGKSMSGTVTYHKGQKFPMTASKRAPATAS